MTKKEKDWIDNASYEELLRKWRFSPIGDPIFQGEVGEYYKKVMLQKRDNHPNPAQVSKNVGWEK